MPHRHYSICLISALIASASHLAVPQSARAVTPMNTATTARPQPGGPDSGLYIVENGNKVDPKTLQGWKTWRAMDCERCHGAEQEGLVGPSLVEALRTLSEDEFHTTIINGRPEKGMPPFGGSKMVTENWEHLYAYLKGRSDGQIKPGHLYPIESGN